MSSPTERARPAVWPWIAAGLLVAAFGLWATRGAVASGALTWMDSFDVAAFRRPGQILEFLAHLRAAIPPVLAVAEIANQLIAGNTDWVTVHLYRASLVLPYVMAIALTWPSLARLGLATALSIVFLWGSVLVHAGGPNVYDTVYPFLLMGFLVALRFGARTRTGALAAGACLALAELTRPFVIALMPLFLFGALASLRPLDRARTLAFLLPILVLSGGWHAHQYLSFGQIVWSNHGGYNIHRAWPMTKLPPLLPEQGAPRLETELPGSFNSAVHGENSRRIQRAVLAHVAAHPLDSAGHAIERMANVLSGEINLKGYIPNSPVMPVYLALVKYPARWVMLAGLVLLAASLLRPCAIAWLVGDAGNLLIISTAATLVIFALTEAGEEARFMIAVLPMLAAVAVPRLTPDPDPVRYRPRTLKLAWAAAIVAIVGIEVFAQGSMRRSAGPAEGQGLAPPVAAAPSGPLRLGVLQARGGTWRDREQAARRIAACLEGLHFVGLNGLRGRSRLDAAPDQATTLAALSGRAGLFAPTERRWWTDSFGNGFVTALPAVRWRREPLPAPRTVPRRNFVIAELAAGTARVHVLVTQIDGLLDHDVQMRIVVERFLALPTPSVLMGELNARRDEPAMVRLLGLPGVDAFTVDLPTPVGPRPVDWIIARGLAIAARTTCDTGVSDHPLLAVELVSRP